ncbi:MAG: PAS domain S-box protein [Pseudomonadota bacterium]
MNTPLDADTTIDSPLPHGWEDDSVRAGFATLLGTLSDGVAVIDAAGDVELINPALTDIFGYVPADLVGKSVTVLMPEPYRSQHHEQLLRYLHTGGSQELGAARKIAARRKDGEIFPAEVRVDRVPEGPERFVVVIRDVTEPLEMQRRLRQNEEELRLTIQNAPTPIATVSLDGKFLSANRAWCTMLGYTEAELLTLQFQDITHPDDLELSVNLLKEARAGERDLYSFEKRYLTKDDRVLYVVLHNGVVHGADGKPVMMVAQVQDLTERRRAEQEIRDQRERLAHVDRLNIMGEMAASIAHEINQPLTAIVNRTNAAQRRLDAGQVDLERLCESLERIGEQAHRAGEVIRRLRTLVRRRGGQRELIDVNSVLQEALRLAEVDARMHDAIIELALEEPLRVVLIDAVQIQQVFLNLLRNAIDATEAAGNRGGVVTVSSIFDDEYVVVSVADRGLGISTETAAQMFEPFFTTKRDGMGMGLSISQSIITAHGGRLWYENNSEGGTTFSFALPPAQRLEDESDVTMTFADAQSDD